MTHPPPEPPPATCPTCLTPAGEQNPCKSGEFQDQVQITYAMNLLQAGVDTSSIALWLGHASTKATDAYLHADLALKERALARTAPKTGPPRRYQPPDRLLAFLEAM